MSCLRTEQYCTSFLHFWQTWGHFLKCSGLWLLPSRRLRLIRFDGSTNHFPRWQMLLAFCRPARPLIGCHKGPSTLPPLTLIRRSCRCCTYTARSNATPPRLLIWLPSWTASTLVRVTVLPLIKRQQIPGGGGRVEGRMTYTNNTFSRKGDRTARHIQCKQQWHFFSKCRDKRKHGKETGQINKLEKKRVIMAGIALKNIQLDSDPGPVGADAHRRSWLSFR